MTKRSRISKIICFLLTAIILMSFVPTAVFADVSASEQNTLVSADFSDPRLDNSKNLSPSQLLSMITDDEISENEADYVDTYFENTVIYNDFVTAEHISLALNEENDGTYTLVAEVREVTYVASNGATVLWTPSSLSVNGDSFPLSPDTDNDGIYTTELSFEESPVGMAVTAEFRCDLELSTEIANSILNFAYTDAESALKLSEEYSATLGKYMDSVKAYREYLDALEIYEKDLSDYEEYVEAKKEYDAEFKKYNDYLAALEKYNSDKKKYDKYQEDRTTYLSDLAKYEEAYEKNEAAITEYKKYLANNEAIRKATLPMEGLFLKPSSGKTRELFGALQNAELIVMFEKHQSKLVNLYGVKEADIKDMRKVSDELNFLLNGYADAREISDKAAFDFYVENYEDITYKFDYLFDKLYTIMTQTLYNHMCGLVELEYKDDPDMATYKKWRIKNVLCHIYIISCCLDDEKTLGGTFDFYSDAGEPYSYYFSELLDNNLIISDFNSADPRELEWMDPVPEPVLPPKPIAPKPVSEPVAPMVIARPTEPRPVTEPQKPLPVEKPEEPLDKNRSFIKRTEAIVSSLEDGELSKRTELSGSTTITVAAEASKKIRPSGEKAVYFINHDGSTYLEETLEGIIDLPTSVPTRPADDAYEYTFSSWSRSPYEPVSPLSVSDDVYLYALFDKSVRSYEITFICEEEIVHKATYNYGDTPDISTFSHKLKKEPTDNTVYTFHGFYPELSTVKKDTVYIADFTSSERLYDITFDILGTKTVKSLPFGAMPQTPPVKSVIYTGCDRFTFKGWDKSVETVSKNTTYTAIYEKVSFVTPPVESSEADITIEINSSSYTVKCDKVDVLEISNLISIAAAEEKRVVFSLTDAEIIFPADTVKALNRNSASLIKFTSSSDGFGFALEDIWKKELSVADEIRMKLPCEYENTNGLSVLGKYSSGGKIELSCAVSDGSAEFIASPDVSYSLTKRFTVTIVTSEGGMISMDKTSLGVGERPTVLVYPDTEHYIVKYIVTEHRDTDTTLELQSLDEYVISDADISIEAIFARKTYTVSFICRGKTIQTNTYFLGDTVKIPEIPSSYEENGYIYTFVGWSSAVGAVTGDTVYTANYYGEPIDETRVPGGDVSALETIIFKQLIPIAVIFVVCISGIIVGIVFLRRTLKKKKAPVTTGTDKDKNDGNE